jgi:hypothetical protein
VDHLGYPLFFAYTALLSVPGLILLYFLVRTGAFGSSPRAAESKLGASADVRRT